MITLSPELLIAAANAFVGLGEEGNDNSGQMVELFLREVKQPRGRPWCAAFVHHVGYWSHFDHTIGESSWPLPATASCWVLGSFAERRRVLRREPEPGDVFLAYSPTLKRFYHTGIVISVDRVLTNDTGVVAAAECKTVEGNTNDDGSANGYTTLARTRRFSERDRFVRWRELKAAEGRAVKLDARVKA